jgi:hypothetical protein
MLFLTYWEWSEKMTIGERLQLAGKLVQQGSFPPEGVKIVGRYLTPDGWGITLIEAESAAAVNAAMMQWRALEGDYFKVTRTAPAMPVEEAIPQLQKILNEVGAA